MISPSTICYALKMTHDFLKSEYLCERTECNRKRLEELSDAVDEIDNLKFEVEGFERVQWVKFDPDDPKTFPPKNECLDVFEQHTKHKWRAVNMFTELYWQRVVEEWSINVNSRGYTIYWRPLPPPPGKEEQK